MTYQKTKISNQVKSTPDRQQAGASASYKSEDRQPPKKNSRSSLRTKIILWAIALSVVPTAIIGAIAYQNTRSQVSQEINRVQQERTHHLADMFDKFIANRIGEAETLAGSPIFTNPNIMGTVTLDQKKSALDSFQEQTGFYDSIVYLDLEGNPLFQSKSDYPLKTNYGDRDYFQQAIEDKQTILNEMGISKYTGKPRAEFAVPVKDAWTDKVIGILRFRIPSEYLMPIFEDYVVPNEEWHLINTQNILFASSVDNLNNQPVGDYFPEIEQAHNDEQTFSALVKDPTNGDREQLINYAPVKLPPAYADLNIGTAIALDTDIAFASLKSLKWIYLGGTIGTVLLIGSLAGFFANNIIKPLQKLTATVDELSQGKLNTRIKLRRNDELAVLGDATNDMAQKLDSMLHRQRNIAKTAELMAKISQSRSSREIQLPFSSFLAEVRQFLGADRVVFYQFNPEWFGTVIAESVAQGFPRTLGVQFDDPCFAKEYVRKYQRGRIQAVTDIYHANLTECHLQQLEPYQVRASLVLPVMLEQSATPETEKLIGLLIVHQCSAPRVWQQSDIDYLQQTASQLSMVLRGYIGTKEETWQKADLQKELSEVLERMKQVAQGDLRNIKIDPDGDPRSAIESFDVAIAELEQTVSKIKAPSQQVNQQLKQNLDRVVQLKDRIDAQTNQLILLFAFVEQITTSVFEVEEQTRVTSQTLDSAVENLESEKVNFYRAIDFMSELDTSLRHNTDKVKNLSHASQKMSKMIGSIRKINLRASLLASKLNQRIPELDDSAYGLKEEIQSIQQSIAATKELENIVGGIDREIAAVLQEYQAKEDRLERENHLVIEAERNLEQIAKTTKESQQRLLSLVNMTKIQRQACQKIDGLKTDININSASMSDISNLAVGSLQKTTLTAQDLENAIDFFKLKSKSQSKSH